LKGYTQAGVEAHFLTMGGAWYCRFTVKKLHLSPRWLDANIPVVKPSSKNGPIGKDYWFIYYIVGGPEPAVKNIHTHHLLTSFCGACLIKQL
jgi:hypothetical protein